MLGMKRQTSFAIVLVSSFLAGLSVAGERTRAAESPSPAPASSLVPQNESAPFARTNSSWQRDPRSDCWIYYPFRTAEIVGVSWSGSCVDHQASGPGTLAVTQYEGTETFTGTFENGHLEGHGVFVDVGRTRVEAEFHFGVENGEGTVTWLDGARYEGQLVNQRRNGKGKLTQSDGSSYEGYFKDGFYSGRGVLTYVDGVIVEGTFAAGNPTGHVIIRFPDGKHISGDYEPSRPDPAHPIIRPRFPTASLRPSQQVFVTFRYIVSPEGAVTNLHIVSSSGIAELDKTAQLAIAQWRFLPAAVDGKPVEYEADDQFIIENGTRTLLGNGHYEGQLVNGMFDGEGKVTWPGGDSYAGTFWQGLESGRGLYKCSDGWIYDGNFLGGALSGHAKITKPDGTSLVGEVVPPRLDPLAPLPQLLYPPDAVRNNRQGSVTVRYRVGVDGVVRNAHVIYSSGNTELDEAAVEQTFRSRVLPGTLNGRPFELEHARVISFVLE